MGRLPACTELGNVLLGEVTYMGKGDFGRRPSSVKANKKGKWQAVVREALYGFQFPAVVVAFGLLQCFQSSSFLLATKT